MHALVVILALLAVPITAEAQPAGRVRTVGLLGTPTDGYRAFREGLRELGWSEGTTVRFEQRFSADYRELSRMAKELVRTPVDVIYAGNAPSVRAAMNATRAIPIVPVESENPRDRVALYFSS